MIRLLLLIVLGWGGAALAAPPQRIITLAPHLTELIYLLKTEDHLIATDSASDWPPAAQKLPKLTTQQSLNIEAILALHPDLILAWQPTPQLERFKDWGVAVHYLAPNDLPDLVVKIQQLGELLQLPEQANRVAQDLQNTIQALTARYSGKPTQHYRYLLWNQPLIGVSSESWIARALALCNAQTIAASISYPRLDPETLLTLDGGWLISAEPLDPHAFRGARLLYSDATRLHRLSPRALEALEPLCQALHAQ